MDIPKVFVSHASEDKERFVIPFATQLRERGIDAWVDKWEMLPGDSLVDKIFEEGLKEAQAVIVVISKYSIHKPWVHEEINATFVKRLSTGSKLIPVVLDNSEVPECLKTTLWQNFNDINNYESDLERVVMSIFGATDKPKVGNPPNYVKTIVDDIPGLSRIDAILINLICEAALVENGTKLIMTKPLIATAEKHDIRESDVLDSLEILDSRGYLKIQKVLNGQIPYCSLTTFGFDQYLKNKLQDEYIEIFNAICLCILNLGLTRSSLIANHLQKKEVIINHMLDGLMNKGLIKGAKVLNGDILIFETSPELKRLF